MRGGVAADSDDFRSRYVSTETPILVISGDHDSSFTLENWYRLIEGSPTLQLISCRTPATRRTSSTRISR